MGCTWLMGENLRVERARKGARLGIVNVYGNEAEDGEVDEEDDVEVELEGDEMMLAFCLAITVAIEGAISRGTPI